MHVFGTALLDVFTVFVIKIKMLIMFYYYVVNNYTYSSFIPFFNFLKFNSDLKLCIQFAALIEIKELKLMQF